MAGAGYPPNPSFSNNFGPDNFNHAPLSICALVEYLSLCLTPDDVVDLSRQLRSFSDADLHALATSYRRRSISLSDSQRSSYLSTFSRASILSTSSVCSQDANVVEPCPNEDCGYESRPTWPIAFLDTSSALQMTNLHKGSQQSQGLQNQDSSYPEHVAVKPICFACNEQFANQGSLSRHQKEQCEREMIAACSLCPSRQAIYYTKERLIRHHVTSHGKSCPNGCSSKKVSGPCKERLCESFVKLPPKRAWGCPFCVSCFRSFEDWNSHCLEHRNKDDNPTSWSFATMVWSLLQQTDYMLARMRYDWWVACDWSKVTEKTCPGFREVLERCTLPHGVRVHESLCSLSDCEAVVLCVYQFMSRGKPFPNQRLFEVQRPSAPQQAPTAFQRNLETTSYVLDEASMRGNQKQTARALTNSRERPDSATVPYGAVDAAAFGIELHPHLSSKIHSSRPGQSRGAEVSDEGETSPGQTRRRGIGLKKTISNLSLRQSSAKAVIGQADPVPQIPPLPDDSKLTEGSKGVAHPHRADESVSANIMGRRSPSPSPGRPMSGVIQSPSWFEVTKPILKPRKRSP